MTGGGSRTLEKHRHNAYKRPVDVFVMEELLPRTQPLVFFPIKIPRFEGDADLHF